MFSLNKEVHHRCRSNCIPATLRSHWLIGVSRWEHINIVVTCGFMIDYRSYTHNLSSEIKAWKKFRPNQDQKSALSLKHCMVKISLLILNWTFCCYLLDRWNRQSSCSSWLETKGELWRTKSFKHGSFLGAHPCKKPGAAFNVFQSNAYVWNLL